MSVRKVCLFSLALTFTSSSKLCVSLTCRVFNNILRNKCTWEQKENRVGFVCQYMTPLVNIPNFTLNEYSWKSPYSSAELLEFTAKAIRSPTVANYSDHCVSHKVGKQLLHYFVFLPSILKHLRGEGDGVCHFSVEELFVCPFVSPSVCQSVLFRPTLI